MRKDGVLPHGDWFRIENKSTDSADDEATVYIYDEIGFWGTEASDFVKELIKLDAKTINLRINSPGGEVFDGLAIYNSLKQHNAYVKVFVDGLAASAASFIAQAGDEVIMARNATMMIHDGIAFAYGNEADLREVADLLSKVSNNIADIYAQRAGETVEYWRDLMRNELWMTGAEAVDLGLADRVLDEDNEEADKATNKWDLATLYNHAGRARAESPTRIAARVQLENQEKEKSMAKATATNDSGTSAEPDGGGQPTGDPNEPGTEVQPTDPGPEPTNPAPTPQENPTPEEVAQQAIEEPENSATGQQGVLINGKLVTDYAVIQQHFQSLQVAQDNAVRVHRREFVENLARDNKIAATQIDSLVLLVNGDAEQPPMSDEQFARFQASYESAGAAPLFSQMQATQPGAPDANGNITQMPTMTADEMKDRVAILQGTVSMLRRQMSEDQVKNTDAFKELQKLLDNPEE